MIFLRNLLIITIIITITYFAFKAYEEPPVDNSIIYRNNITDELLTPSQDKEPPHYRFISKPVIWSGKLIGMTKKKDNTIKLNFWIDETRPEHTDTILITKIDNINQYYNAKKNKFLQFQGKIVKIEINDPGKEIVYVNGFIKD